MRVPIAVVLVLCLVSGAMALGGDLKSAEKQVRSGLISGSEKTLTAGVAAAVKVNNADAVKMLLKYAEKPTGEKYEWMTSYTLLLTGVASMNSRRPWTRRASSCSSGRASRSRAT